MVNPSRRNQDATSPCNSSVLSRKQIMRTDKLIGLRELPKDQILLSNLQGNIWLSEERIYHWILGDKGLRMAKINRDWKN